VSLWRVSGEEAGRGGEMEVEVTMEISGSEGRGLKPKEMEKREDGKRWEGDQEQEVPLRTWSSVRTTRLSQESAADHGDAAEVSSDIYV
jgi:hypothetical protein